VYRCYGRQSGKNFELIKAPDELIDAPPVLSDVDGDGAMDVVQTYPGGKVSVSNAENGTPKSKAYPRSAIEAQTVIVPSPSVGASCAVGLAPGRAEEFVVVSSNDQNGLVYCSSGGAEQLRWALLMNELLPGATYREVVTHLAGPVLGDLTADAQPDVVVGTRFGPLAALDGVTHKSLWQYQGDWPAVLATPALYDFDKDGAADVAFADSRGGVHVVSGRTGQALARTQPDDVKVFASPLVADVDGNGAVDIVVQNAAGLVRILTTNSRTPEKRTFWEMEGGTPGREGTEEFRGFRTRQKLLILASLAGVLLLLATANVVLLLVRASSRRRLEKLGAY